MHVAWQATSATARVPRSARACGSRHFPPPGPFTVACEWPAFGISLAGIEFDGRTIRDAAARAGAMFSTDMVRRDGRDWRLGTAADMDWINTGTSPGMTITSSIPPVFDAYCTIVPRGDGGSEVSPPGHVAF